MRTPLPRVVLVGAGGIGHPALWALAQARDIALTVIDDDRVEASNLPRLAFARDDEAGARKVDVAARLCAELGRDPRAHDDRFVAARVLPETARELLAGAAVVVEGADNFPTKFLVADACGLARVPVVHGAAVRWLGTVLPVVWGRGACYRCVYEDVPGGFEAVDCASAGVYGPVTALVGALMAADALRLARGQLDYAGRLAGYDARAQAFRESAPRPRNDCPLCGARPSIDSLDASRYIANECATG